MFKRAILVCNGSLTTKEFYSIVTKDDFIVAVDGGANKLLKTKFVPNIIIGDMDSINSTAKKKYSKVTKICFPREKDLLDLELAINYCIEQKFSEIVILGAFGSRHDMSLTNVFLLSQIPENINAKIVNGSQEIFLIRKNELVLSGIPGEKISIFPIKGDAKGITLEGFKYCVQNYDLRFGIGFGLSNEFKNKKARISFKDGMLLCVHFHKWF
jgi:thiamine pyrophosphokinase